jgi:hypothetical protein
LKHLRTGAGKYQRIKFSALTKDGLVASGRELVGITLRVHGEVASTDTQAAKNFPEKLA